MNGQLSMMTTSPHLSIGTRRGLRCAFMISLEDCVALSGLTEGQDPPADQPIVQSLEPAACFVPYLLTTQVEVSCGGFPDAWRASFLSRSFPARRRITLVSSAQAQFREQRSLVDWRTFEVPDFGTSIQYPASIFAPAGKPEKGLGQRFESADGRAALSIYSRPNDAGESPKTYLRHNLRVALSASDYVRITRSFFAISTERHGVILYSRCNFSGGARGVIHCFDLKYPQQEKRSWDAVVTRISLSLRPLES